MDANRNKARDGLSNNTFTPRRPRLRLSNPTFTPCRPQLRPALPRILNRDRITLSIPRKHFTAFSALAKLILERDTQRKSPAPHSAVKNRRARLEGAKSGSMWLTENLEKLQKLKKQGMENAEIAKILGCSASAVSQQWRKLNLKA